MTGTANEDSETENVNLSCDTATSSTFVVPLYVLENCTLPVRSDARRLLSAESVTVASPVPDIALA